MKRTGWLVVVLALAAVGWFYYRNLRGAGPSLRSPAPGIVNATNTTNLPLALPSGVSISIFARDLGAPRVLAQDPRGVLVASLPSAGSVIALPDRNGDNVADEVVVVASGLNRPHGLTFDDQHLFIAETNQMRELRTSSPVGSRAGARSAGRRMCSFVREG